MRTALILVCLLALAALPACGGEEEPTPTPYVEPPTPTPYVPPATATPIVSPTPEPEETQEGETEAETPTPEGEPDRQPIPTAITEFRPTPTPTATALPPEQLMPTLTPTPYPPTREETQEMARRLALCLTDSVNAKERAKIQVYEHLMSAGDEDGAGEALLEIRRPQVVSSWLVDYLLRHVPRWNEEDQNGDNSWIVYCREREQSVSLTPGTTVPAENTPQPQGSGKWYRDKEREGLLGLEWNAPGLRAVFLQALALNEIPEAARQAMLDTPGAGDRSVGLGLVCIPGAPEGEASAVIFLEPYGREMPAGAEAVYLRVRNLGQQPPVEAEMVAGAKPGEKHVRILETSEKLDELVQTLQLSAAGLRPNQVLTAGVITQGAGRLQATLDATGMEQALEHASCFNERR